MAQLDHILGAVLTGIVRARADADKYSAKMAREYLTGDDPILSGFPVPRATIDAVKLDLRFAVQSTRRSVRFDETGVGVASGAIVARVAQLMIKVFHNQPAGAVPWDQLVASATKPAVVDAATSSISRFLFGALGGGVSGALDQYIDDSGNLTDKDKLVAELVEQLDTYLIKRPEFAAAGATVLLQVKGQVPGAISSLVDRLQQVIATDLDVIIDTEALRAVPTESIMTLAFQLSLKDYQWRQEQPSDTPAPTAPRPVAAQAARAPRVGAAAAFDVAAPDDVGPEEPQAPQAPHELPPGFRLVGT